MLPWRPTQSWPKRQLNVDVSSRDDRRQGRRPVGGRSADGEEEEQEGEEGQEVNPKSHQSPAGLVTGGSWCCPVRVADRYLLMHSWRRGKSAKRLPAQRSDGCRRQSRRSTESQEPA